MKHIRFSIASLLLVVLFVAAGFAALRESNETWNSGVFTLTLAALLISILLAIHRTESRRAFWIGFALFGWIYLGLSLVPRLAKKGGLVAHGNSSCSRVYNACHTSFDK